MEKFNEKVNQMMETYKLNHQIMNLQNTSNVHLHNEIDELITTVLAIARKAVEGPTRSLPFS